MSSKQSYEWTTTRLCKAWFYFCPMGGGVRPSARPQEMAKSLPDYLCIDYEMPINHNYLFCSYCSNVFIEQQFYKDKLKAAGIKPEDVQSLADFSHIPFTVKGNAGTPYRIFEQQQRRILSVFMHLREPRESPPLSLIQK